MSNREYEVSFYTTESQGRGAAIYREMAGSVYMGVDPKVLEPGEVLTQYKVTVKVEEIGPIKRSGK